MVTPHPDFGMANRRLTPQPNRRPNRRAGHLESFSRLVIEMTKNVFAVIYILTLIAVVVSVDLLFFKNRFWERLMVNIGIVLVFAAFYLRFIRSP
jgi:uncharacterized membrane protein